MFSHKDYIKYNINDVLEIYKHIADTLNTTNLQMML